MSKHYVYVVEHDRDPSNPREENEGYVGTMWCAHRRSNLGDKQFDGNKLDLMKRLVEEREPGFIDRVNDKFDQYYDTRQQRQEQELQEWRYVEKAFDRYYLFRDLYLYDHSGLTMNTTGFSCGWDSGQVGMIVVSKEKAREAWGWKILTRDRVQRVLDTLDEEVKEYAQYLEGEVYGFRVFEVPEHILEEYTEDPEYDLQEVVEFIDTDECEEVEYRWGYYGDKDAIAEAKDMVEYLERTYKERLARAAGQLDLALESVA